MGNGLKLGDLKERALYLADQQLGFIDPDQLTKDAQDACLELHDILVAAFEDYSLKIGPITTTADTQQYALPADFYKERKVFKIVGADRVELKKFELKDLQYSTVDFNYLGAVARYRILDANIWIHPTPTAGETYELWYAKHLAVPEDDESFINFSAPGAWRDFLIYALTAKMQQREESDPSVALAEKEHCRQLIAAAVQQRDGEPEAVQDYYNRWEPW